MRWLLLVLLLPLAAGAPDARLDARDAALAFLQEHDANGPYVVEALVAAGIDPATWPGRTHNVMAQLHIPAGTGASVVRPLHAAALVGPMHDDPIRGRVDVAAQLTANVDAVMNAESGAVAFQILAMHALDLDVPAALLQRLQSLGNGTWGCGGPADVECTGFAVVALAAAGGLDGATADAARRFILSAAPDGRWGQDCPGGNTQRTVWAIHALNATGHVPDWAWERLLENQRSDGGFCFAGTSNAWATAEAATVLSQTFPFDGELRPHASASHAWWVALGLLLWVRREG